MNVTPFSLTVNIIVEAFIALLAVMAARNRPRHHLNRKFLLFLFLLLLWTPTMAVKGYLFSGAPRFLFLIYRWSLSVAALGLGSFALFAVSLQKGEPPARRLTLALALPSLALFCVGLLTPWVIRDAWPERETVQVATGPLYPLIIAYLIIACLLSFRALTVAMRTSSGYTRARNLNFLVGFSLFVLPVTLSGFIFHLKGGLDPTGTVYYAVSLLPPLALFGYAVLRYRQLDIHIAAVQAASYLLAVLTLGLPSASVVITLEALKAPTATRYGAYLALLTLTVLLAPPVLRAAERTSSRLFLMRLYDPPSLLARVSSLLFSSQGLEEGVRRSTATLVRTMRLRELTLALHPFLPGTYAGRSMGARLKVEGSILPVDELNPPLEFLQGWSGPLFTADPLPAAESDGSGFALDEALGELREAGLEAALPVVGGGGLLGMLLAGRKRPTVPKSAGRREAGGLSPLDYDTLEKFAAILAPFVENGLISSYLQDRVSELTSIEAKMEEEEERRSALASSAYRSMLDPLTRMRSSTDLLKDRALPRDAKERRQVLDRLLEAAEELDRRISRMVGQILELRQGHPGPSKVEADAGHEPFDLQMAILEVKALFSPACAARIKVDTVGGIFLSQDRTRFREGLALLAEFCLRETGDEGEVRFDCQVEEGVLRIKAQCRPGKGEPLPFMRVFSPLSLLILEQADSVEERMVAARAASSLFDTEVSLFDGDGEVWGFCLEMPMVSSVGAAAT